MFGIYIHWPFCLSKCPYCDFFSQVDKNASQEEIIKSYLNDLDFYHKITNKQKVTSIFFGGGTPSLIEPQYIEKIINHIKKNWTTASDIEISLEANPNSQTPNLFSDLKSAGINRLSLGVQALNDNDLAFLGRSHSLEQAMQAIESVLKTFDNHSMDLIYARPEQTILQWEKELSQAKSLGFKHLSLYQLTIEENTKFYKDQISAMEEDGASKLYLLSEEILKKQYSKYEVSNYAQKGFEAKHNLTYWRGFDYLGIGKSAEGRIGLCATTHKNQIEKLLPQERAAELLLMGIRIAEGIDKDRFFSQCSIKFEDFINQEKLAILQEHGLVDDTKKNLKATAKGFLVINQIVEQLYS